ncbi:uncharacterized protein BDR25DRAFT_367927 [Lindgomyces ingoldianus]|uniref:Uncharacterized protein n=1 Tax=Lindgomyces ingoldianus TaxID=673940 RepID=A0ACB6QYL9_9PLEO|nr:uncharacterized protein BDR25DRAFT_367927 [Lindgomyces ingoldianus]KAF2471187.1 hypothetical protein BDR25DRAFT_367927 [Lindgomyces ingoldianus]
MADIWSGDIVLADNTAIREADVTLASHQVASSPALPATALRFLSSVNTAHIPLCLVVGPSWNVWTSCEDTERWFHSIVGGKAPAVIDPTTGNAAMQDWWTYPRSQSPIGILVQVEGEAAARSSPRVTEILFYGAISTPANRGFPTPPSSSPELAHPRPEVLPDLRVHALPLSSELLNVAAISDIPLLSPPVLECDAQFLSSVYTNLSATSSPKRKRDLFDEATQLRTKVRRKGGEGVAAAAARASDAHLAPTARRSLSIDTRTTPFPESRPESANDALSRPPSRLHSRSPSISSDIRPLSRKGTLDGQARRSALCQVATVSLQPEEPTTEMRNKESLSRVVMAAMRMHGLQQRKKNKARHNSVAPGADMAEQLSEEAAAEEAAKDGEYKLIYHQTYKGAVLALRKHISTKPLHSQPDRLRDIVEKLLVVFCTDPLAEPLPSDEAPNLLATPGSQRKLGIPGSTHSQASPFDLPKASRMHSGSPRSRSKRA